MTLRRWLIRFLIAVLAFNAAGTALGAGELNACIAHELELAKVPAGVEDSEHALPDCKHGCQAHCAQHVTALPQSIASAYFGIAGAPIPELVVTGVSLAPSPHFRPPRSHSLTA